MLWWRPFFLPNIPWNYELVVHEQLSIYNEGINVCKVMNCLPLPARVYDSHD